MKSFLITLFLFACIALVGLPAFGQNAPPTVSAQLSGTTVGVNGIQVSPVTPNLAIGATLPFSAAPITADGNGNIDLSGQCVWTSSNTAVAVFLSSPGNILKGISGGSSTITCTLAGGTYIGSTIVTVGSFFVTNPTCASPPCVMAAGTNGVAYPSFTFLASGGVLPYTWSVSAGALPGGLSLASSTGILSGTPNANGSFTATIQVADVNSLTATVQISITVASAICTSNPPTTYCSDTSTTVFPGPNNPPSAVYGTGALCATPCNLYGQNLFFTDTSIGNNAERILRVTDYATSTQGSHTTSASGTLAWGCTPGCAGSTNYFFDAISPGGCNEFFSFNPSTFQVSSLSNCLLTANGGYTINVDTGGWSPNNGNVFYGAGNTSSNWVVQTPTSYTVNLALGNWTSSSITPTSLLDPTGSECNGLGSTPSQLWNRYMWSNIKDVSAANNDTGGAGTGSVAVLYGYQQDESAVAVLYDGTQVAGHKCTWWDWRRGILSIHGNPAIAMTGFTPLAPPAPPTIVMKTTGGSINCTGTYQWLLEITYTIAGAGGESLPSAPVTFSPSGQGSSCSFVVTAPSALPSLGGITSVHPSGYNVYLCRQQLPNFPCTNSTYFLVPNSANPAGALAQPVIQSVTCSPTGGGQSYTYQATVINGGGQSIPSLPVTVNNCPIKLNSSNTVTVTLTNPVAGATYEFMRDFSSAGFASASTVFVDQGGYPSMYVPQTVPIGTGATVTAYAIGTPNLFPPTVNTAGVVVHGASINANATWAAAGIKVALQNDTNIKLDLSNGAAVTVSNDVTHGTMVQPCGPHASTDNTHVYCPGTTGGGGVLNPVRYTFNDSGTTFQASALLLNSMANLRNIGDDAHYTYPFSTDGKLVFMNSYVQNGSYALPIAPWEHEFTGFPTTASTTPIRLCRNWASGANGFNSSPRGNVSQDGKYAIWSDDWAVNITGTSTPVTNGTIGFGGVGGTKTCVAGSCRAEVMLCEFK